MFQVGTHSVPYALPQLHPLKIGGKNWIYMFEVHISIWGNLQSLVNNCLGWANQRDSRKIKV
jgi:hypothetical protein